MDDTTTSALCFSALHRELALERAASRLFDIVVVGGGITGAGVLLDAASRGLSVILLEKNDFASGTSSRSSRLIHGGLRYLENFDVGVVTESLRERAILLRRAPHLVWATPFVIPLFKTGYFARKRPVFRAGLTVYDMLGASLRGMRHRLADRADIQKLIPGIDGDLYDDGILYWDAVNDDARTCISVLKTGIIYGGSALNHCEVVGVSETRRGVEIQARDHLTGLDLTVRGRALVNATGVFADAVARRLELRIQLPLVPSRGAHLVLRRPVYPGIAAVVLPVESDRRFIFVVPLEDKVVVGTTDTSHSGNLDDPEPAISDVRYIADTFDRWALRKLNARDVSGLYAGLRPLVASKGSASTSDISRRHVAVIGAKRSVTITGGKFTAYRKMAQETVDLVCSAVLNEAIPRSRTDRISLFGACDYVPFRTMAAEHTCGGSERDLRMLWRRYGMEALRVLRYQREFGLPGAGGGQPWCLEGQVLYAIRHESAATLEDLVFRRLRIGSDDFETASALAPVISEIASSELASGFGQDAADDVTVTRIQDLLQSRLKKLSEALR